MAETCKVEVVGLNTKWWNMQYVQWSSGEKLERKLGQNFLRHFNSKKLFRYCKWVYQHEEKRRIKIWNKIYEKSTRI